MPPGRLSLQRIRAREVKGEREYRGLPVAMLRVCRNISSSPPPPFMPLFVFLSFRKRWAVEQCYTCQKKKKFQHKVGIFSEYFRQNPLFKWKTRREWQFPPNSRCWYEFTVPEIRSRVQCAKVRVHTLDGTSTGLWRQAGWGLKTPRIAFYYCLLSSRKWCCNEKQKMVPSVVRCLIFVAAGKRR